MFTVRSQRAPNGSSRLAAGNGPKPSRRCSGRALLAAILCSMALAAFVAYKEAVQPGRKSVSSLGLRQGSVTAAAADAQLDPVLLQELWLTARQTGSAADFMRWADSKGLIRSADRDVFLSGVSAASDGLTDGQPVGDILDGLVKEIGAAAGSGTAAAAGEAGDDTASDDYAGDDVAGDDYAGDDAAGDDAAGRSSGSGDGGGGERAREEGEHKILWAPTEEIRQSILDMRRKAKRAPVGPPLACPAPTKAAAERVAQNNTIIFALMNQQFIDFGMNWYMHLQKLEVNNIWVAVYEDETARVLVERGIPCFDARSMLQVNPKMKFELGNDNSRAMVWGKVTIANMIVQYGFNLVLSDTDVIWFKDPNQILAENAQADLLMSTDALETFLEAGDQGLEDPAMIFKLGISFNTGIMLLRNTAATRKLLQAWADLRLHPMSDTEEGRRYFSDQDALNEHYLRPGVNVMETDHFDVGGSRLIRVFNFSVALGVFPITRFVTGHTYSVQRLHEIKRVVPYVLHTTYVYGDQAGKRSRLREAGLWLADPPKYFDGPRFLSIDVQLPPVPEVYDAYREPNGTLDWDLDRQIAFHLTAIQFQMEQLYYGLALATALGRIIILPRMTCFCDKNWYMTDDQCQTPGAHELRYPYVCPADYLFWPGRFKDFRVHSFLDHPALPDSVKASRKVVTTSPTLKPGAPAVGAGAKLSIPTDLDDNQIRFALRGAEDVRILHFADARNAFKRFADPGDLKRFQALIKKIAGEWCCYSPTIMETQNIPGAVRHTITPFNERTATTLFEMATWTNGTTTTATGIIKVPLEVGNRLLELDV